jgi:methylmalonyl-CoA/ethylmalonyl-CoA epimerase
MFADPGEPDRGDEPGAGEERMSKVDHVGIAVNALSDSVPLYEALLGTPPSGREVVESEGVRVAFFGEGAGRVELLEPTAADSPVARFLERRGPGLHHVCLVVDDLDAALAGAADRGAEPLPPGIRVGAGGRRVAFLHPRSTGGVLLEMVEAEPDPRAESP